MTATPSTMLELETRLQEFSLPDYEGTVVSSGDFANKPLLVVFICNHCPYVKHVVAKFSQLAKEFQARGVEVVAISSNDITMYSEDAPDKMAEFSNQHRFTFPYLYDESQDVAKAFTAACTPDFFLFDRAHQLVYRGQMDGSRPGNNVPVTGIDLKAAVESMLRRKPMPQDQVPSIGCNIKWKKGNEPDYFTMG